MGDDFAVSEKRPNAAAQAITAVVLIGGIGAALWGLDPRETQAADEPATCSPASTAESRPSGNVSGDQLCTALNRPDLATLLGTPTEKAKTAGGSDSYFTSGDGTKTATPSGEVTFETYTVKLSATYDGLAVAEEGEYLGRTAEPRTVLGRPAVLYTTQTIALRFNLGGGDSESGPGVPARSLVIAQTARDRGGSFELTVFREDGMPPDDEALLRVAEQVLPTIPGWNKA
ncbi:hypothetical protein SLINC_7675 [Streptomyces lincolnensis]|uniref:Uncharacterized protein n=1 Tax=Streptomyces lincolnensis TaxID=1915 RepID=A0A1B1MMR7_STRLN|nr:DUF6215 domain-containing protein [Streptomyces lincolnensis]ANS69899.1 hypothetical protein SLINC_7675 [Streptomyces lincolnensis]AXG58817.1 hypothetical protein SLCG_7662 [Streptomyces lincolnensis]QMV11435.1 hypothetical protein GJU35_40985 [Streptomyces lincolnensis]